MDGYYGGQKSKVREISEKAFAFAKQRPFVTLLIVGIITVIILLVLDYGFDIPIFRKKDGFGGIQRLTEGISYDWGRRKLLAGHRVTAINLLKQKYELKSSLETKDFVNFSDFNLFKFIEESDEIDDSSRAKVLLMLHPEFRKYQDIIFKATTLVLPDADARKTIHAMLTAAGIIMPALDTVTDVQLIAAWKTTKSPMV